LGLHLLNTDTAPLQHWLEQRALALQRRALTAGVV
jgi:hypothetical protein